MSVRRRSLRLSRAFAALVLAAGPLAAAQACSDDVIVREIPAGPDGTVVPGEAAAQDALADSAAYDGLPTLDAACQVVTETLDADADADPPCRYTLPCGLASDTAFVIRGCGFYLVQADDAGDSSLGCSIPEAYGCSDDVYTPPANGSVTFECIDCLGGAGRRPNGLLRAPEPGATPSALAAWFVRMAQDEAASVHAFARMHEELTFFAAPRGLVAEARRAVSDEQRHARAMGRHARSRGAIPTAPRVRAPRRRSLESMARENAVEGCVREAFGALVLRWQAEHAATPELRGTFLVIAADETRHAALSWELARWAEAQLPARAQARVASARRRALRDLRERLRERPGGEVDGVIGAPPSEVAQALLAGLERELAEARLS
ncbi:MAG: putative lipoprotein [Labilithrix sp.]|nr:putative lipoprotein [Labilithrix sp.]